MSIADAEFLKNYGIKIDFSKLRQISPDQLVTDVKTKIISNLSHMEESSKEYQNLGENGFSSILVTALNNCFPFCATREQNGRGHVDITITSPSCAEEFMFKYKGEAKIWNGDVYALGGFKQLMGYITGRQKNAFCMFYFKTVTCDDIFNNWPDNLIIKKGGSLRILEKRFATTFHKHSSGDFVEIDHYAAHFPPS